MLLFFGVPNKSTTSRFLFDLQNFPNALFIVCLKKSYSNLVVAFFSELNVQLNIWCNKFLLSELQNLLYFLSFQAKFDIELKR